MINPTAETVHNNELSAQQLIAEEIPLSGCHLIEASAGTGKTYNITRIYLRLLLEKHHLDVKNILVMTFTRAATDELRARIAAEIRYALENWGRFEQNDSFYLALTKKFKDVDVRPLLHHALLHLDEAAIFTIHGFCKRVLSQQAFSSGVDFNVQMEADTVDIELEAIRDWYRILSRISETKSSHNCYQLLTQRWPSPDDFHQSFSDLLSSTTKINTLSEKQIKTTFLQQKKNCLLQMQESESIIFYLLINQHKQQKLRAEEWQVLIGWLSDETTLAMPKQATNVFNGSRFAKNNKAQLLEIFDSLKQLKVTAEKIEQQLQSAQIYHLAAQGIENIRHTIEQAKQHARLMNYDDLINHLARCLSNESNLAQLIKEQYPVALVDEFQDTDPQQYAILQAVYQCSGKQINSDAASASALYMIGDPKQAIYAFRSGDVFTYLSARAKADYLWHMDTNWRSSRQMVHAYNRLFHGAPLSDINSSNKVFGFNIHYHPVKSTAKAEQTPLLIEGDSRQKSALNLAYFPLHDDYISARGQTMKQDFCTVIAAWCVHEIHQLLSGNSLIGEQPLEEQDIAILVRDKTEAGYIQQALEQANYPSVYLSNHDNVFLSEEAKELKQVLQGILNLENERLLTAALSTRFFSCNSDQLYALKDNEEDWEKYRNQVYALRERWLKYGFMSMALELFYQDYIPDSRHHERALTNALQLVELLQQASQQYRQPEQLIHWLVEQTNQQSASAEAELRLESDANLIRIITQHGSKGLEYPIVFIPFASRYKDPARFANKTIDLFKYHHPQSGELNYFIGQQKSIIDRYREEAHAETIRLLYVAITRAKYRCYLGITAFADFHLSPLGQTLKLCAGDDLHQALVNLMDSADNAIALRQVEQLNFPVTRAIESIDEETYSPALFSAHIERNWWLSSFSALTRNLRHGGISTPDHDESESFSLLTQRNAETDKICFSLTKGAATGNLLHDILEHCDFSQPDWQQSMQRPISRFNENLDEQQQNKISDWLEQCLASRLPNGPRLNELVWEDTLRETEFYFPMAQLEPAELGQLLATHRQQRNSQEQPKTILLPGYRKLQGMMHGFIDLIFHWQGKYYIVDYKSAHLGFHYDDYHYSILEKNINDNYYDLQYLLYSLALHRYLKNRLADYSPEKYFGGVYYLYLRGMLPDSEQGIFTACIGNELLSALDALFAAPLLAEPD